MTVEDYIAVLRELGIEVEGRRDLSRAVAHFQERLRLPVTKELDPATREVLDAWRRPPVEPAAPATPTGEGVWQTVSGTVAHESLRPAAGARVQAVSVRLRQALVLGEALTDAAGRFEIRYVAPSGEHLDVEIRILSDAGEDVWRSQLLTFARPAEVVEVVLPTGTLPEHAEYDRVAAALVPLLEGVDATEVVSGDLPYLAARSGEQPRDIAAYSVAHRLAAQTDVPADHFYALLRSDLPTSLDAVLANDPTVHEAAIARAAAEGIVGPAVSEAARDNAGRLTAVTVERLAREEERDVPGPFPAVLAQVLPDAERRARLVRAYLDRGPDADSFWHDLREDPEYGEDVADDLLFSIRAGVLARGHLPIVAKLRQMRAQGEVRTVEDLAGFTERDWVEVFASKTDDGPVGVPEGVPGSSPKDRSSAHARAVVRMLEDAMPTAALVEKARRQPESALGRTGLVAFADANAGFDLLGAPVAQFLEEATFPPDHDNRALLDELGSVQRLAKMSPRHSHIEPLYAAGYRSAAQIARRGKGSFVQQMADAVGASEAADIYDRADRASAMATALVMQLDPHYNAERVDAVTSPILSGAGAAGLPDWETLFGSLELCSCDHCRSVFSPAAYLVDLLAFLTAIPATRADGSPDPTASGVDVLLSRRPEINALLLSCENTNTEVPYLDLVNEILESTLLRASGDPDAAAAAPPVQTVGTAAERGAAPQALTHKVYTDYVGKAVYPWTLPFDLAGTETETWLEHLDTSRRDVAVAVTAGDPATVLGSSAVTAAALLLSPAQIGLIVGEPLAPKPKLWTLYGYDSQASLHAAIANVGELTRRTGSTYSEVLELLGLRWINQSGDVAIDPASAECDIDAMGVLRLDDDTLDRLHRFVRLRRALGWSATDLDRAIVALADGDPPGLDAAALARIATAQRVAERLRVPITTALSWWGPLDNHDYTPTGSREVPSPYARQFLNPALGDPASSPFLLAATGDELLDTQRTVAEVEGALSGALRLGASDVRLLLAEPLPGGITAALTPESARLSLALLTTLAREASLARALGLPIRDYLSLRSLAGVDPFDRACPAAIWHLADAADQVRRSGTTFAELDWLLRHRERTSGKPSPTERQITLTLEAIRAGMARIATEYAAAPDADGAATRKLVGILAGGTLAEATVGTLLGQRLFTAPLGALPGTVELSGSLANRVAFDAQARELTVTGALTSSDRDELLSKSGQAAYQAAVGLLFDRPRMALFDLAVAASGAAVEFRAPLASLPPVADPIPRGLTSLVSYDSERMELVAHTTLSDRERDALSARSGAAAWQAAVSDLHGQPRTRLATTPSFADPTLLGVQLLDSADTAPARLASLQAAYLPYLRRTMSERLVRDEVTTLLGLDGATVRSMLTNWVRNPDDATQPALAALLSVGSQPTAPTRDTAPVAFDALTRLVKAARILTRLGSSRDETAWTFTHGPTRGWLDLGMLPLAPDSADASDLFTRWSAMAQHAELRRCVPPGETRLIDLYDSPSEPRADRLHRIEALTGWAASDLDALATQLGLAYPADFGSQAALVRMRPALLLAERLGVTAAELIRWGTTTPDPTISAAAQQVAKAKHDIDEWLAMARPRRDRLREAQRDALVAYLLTRPQLAGGVALRDSSSLYEHLLVDVDMSACMPSSRIVLAVAAVQLLVQRALLNLEPRLKLSPVDAREWQWRKNYRVWEAQRRVLVAPENYLVPELRDDKSDLFRALETELLQTAVTNDSAEAAFGNYLKGLDAVSRLEPCGAFHELRHTRPGQVETDVLHVIGRTHAKPRRHFYRQQVNQAQWTAWSSIDVEINGDHILPVMYNRRLYAMWLEFVPGADAEVPAENASPADKLPNPFVDVALCWTERSRDGKWGGKRVSAETTRLRIDHSAIDTLSIAASEDGEGDLLIRVSWSFASANLLVTLAWFRISGTDGSVVVEEDLAYVGDAKVARMRRWYQGFREDVGNGLRLPYTDHVMGGVTETDVLMTTPGRHLIVPATQSALGTDEPVFFLDDRKAFFVVPSWQRVTVPVLIVDNPSLQIPIIDIDWEEYVPVPIPKVGPDDYLPDPIADVGWEGVVPTRFDPRVVNNGVPQEALKAAGPRTFLNTVLRGAGAKAIGEVAVPVALGPGAKTLLATGSTPLPVASLGEHLASPTFAMLTGDVAGGPSYARKALLSTGGSRGGFRNGIALTADRTSAGSYAMTAAGTQTPSEGRVNAFLVGAAIAPELVTTFGVGAAIQNVVTFEHRQFYTFRTWYHPFVRMFVRRLNRFGVDGLLQRDVQIAPEQFAEASYEGFDFVGRYQPVTGRVTQPFPAEDVDFSYEGAYSQYNWELFFHVPLLIAQRLRANQRFAEAQQWLHYIFDPTDTSANPIPQRYWRTRPFFESAGELPIQRLLELLHGDSSDPVVAQRRAAFAAEVDAWRLNPFRPHVLARLRPVAYQKAVVMAYVDLLIAWGDYLFRQDTMETVAEATQLYLLAAALFGERPIEVARRTQPQWRSFADLRPDLDAVSNAAVSVENLLHVPDRGATQTSGGRQSPSPAAALPPTLYFCVPRNDKLVGYWDLIADRLFKIRHCLNIEGVERQLALFAPPIDPALIARAVAAGVSIDAAVNGLSSGSLPVYRFSTIAPVAAELARHVAALGAALLSALEKRDAEALAVLRSTHEISVHNATVETRKQQIREAESARKALDRARAVTAARQHFYTTRPYMNEKEAEHIAKLDDAYGHQNMAQELEVLAGALALIPQFEVGAEGAFSSPVAKVGFGGQQLSGATQVAARVFSHLGNIANQQATMASIIATYDRRRDDWEFQAEQAKLELKHLDEQIAGADLRKAINERELQTVELQRDSSREAETFLREKYTNQELYDWMVGQISALYFQAYQLAYDTAKRAERAYQHELGDKSASFVQFGYWDGLRKGLLAGERLHLDVTRMQSSYLDRGRREYEITKHVSLVLTDPAALVKLRSTGACDLDLPETLFDQDHPGHYYRRLKTASITVPSVTGPYSGVHGTLTLMRDATRVTPEPGAQYGRTGSEDARFADSQAPMQSIAISTGQNDSGLFETLLRDERYLPFEGAGAISRWHLEIPRDANAFDTDSIADVVLHLRYTAREGGRRLRDAAAADAATRLAASGVRLLSARTDAGTEWSRFATPGITPDRTMTLDLSPDQFPYALRGKTLRVKQVALVLRGPAQLGPVTFTVTPPNPDETTPAPSFQVEVKPDERYGGLPRGTGPRLPEGDEPGFGSWSIRAPEAQLATHAFEDLLLLVEFAMT